MSKRTRTGCLCCRRRHKKCDEKKPVCKFCSAKGLQCEWPRKGSIFVNYQKDEESSDNLNKTIIFDEPQSLGPSYLDEKLKSPITNDNFKLDMFNNYTLKKLPPIHNMYNFKTNETIPNQSISSAISPEIKYFNNQYSTRNFNNDDDKEYMTTFDTLHINNSMDYQTDKEVRSKDCETSIPINHHSTSSTKSSIQTTTTTSSIQTTSSIVPLMTTTIEKSKLTDKYHHRGYQALTRLSVDSLLN
ncbi:hypothetical protein WICMUC_003817 [Wickerhamomyces mucosus]|uniref:Zn(2)-C6 fungal-type domain-containing protein n=1 Tax=Wickerhamomyces mucosus TaxID=1378264 RepID=A0A9P8PKZ9_9ASCO|nr:hypothetical protein WICMUC_003817 [Wickerhamomyces mucosus]